MAKAQIEGPDGVSIKLEGTPDEISAVLNTVKAGASKNGRRAGQRTRASKKVASGKTTVTTLAEDLRNEGFFKKPKTLGEVRSRLADLGHNYPLTGLSGPMRREVKGKKLRRFKEKGKYVYTQ
jgi:hypothetical protein